MLTEKRYEMILELLDKKRSVTVPEIKEVLRVSESTIRRDLTALDKAGRLTKVFGGAVSAEGTFTGTEPSVAQKLEVQQEEKRRIAQFAAGLIQADDFLHNMARLMIGTLLDIGFGLRKKEDIEAIFNGEKTVGNPCDPKGLYLQEVEY